MAKGIMYIDGQRVPFDGEKNVLAVIRKAGINMPTFCYYSELSTFGACRMCVVEDERGKIDASCSMEPRDGMKIRTNTEKLLKHRRMILELILASHCRDCTICEKNQTCRLQELAGRLGLTDVRFPNTREAQPVDDSSVSIVRDPSKCILCGDCVRVCNEVQHVGAIDFANRGSSMIVTPAFGKKLAETNCVNCGQCAAVCPTAAIKVKTNLDKVWRQLYDPGKRVVVQVAPAVRVALGEAFGLAPGEDSIGKIFTAIRMLGFDAVYDTCVGADLTIMEEGSEFVERFTHKSRYRWPMFTSCCPAWIRFAETKHPDIMPYISSCKSPMEMFGAVLKEYYKDKDKEEGKETISMAVMPCVAKKMEAVREEFIRDGVPDIDYVITTKELIRMIRESGIQFDEIDPEAPDMPFSIFSGAGVIFGVTGGVMEAALRTAYYCVEGVNPPADTFSDVRGFEGRREAEFSLGGRTLRTCTVSGLKNARDLIEDLRAGTVHYDFVEVMACPGGCVGGGGQPILDGVEMADVRGPRLYKLDEQRPLRFSHDNPGIKKLYAEYMGAPLGEKAHQLLHTHN